MGDWRTGVVAVLVLSWLVLVTGQFVALVVLLSGCVVACVVLNHRFLLATRKAERSAEVCGQILEDVTREREAQRVWRAAQFFRGPLTQAKSEVQH